MQMWKGKIPHKGTGMFIYVSAVVLNVFKYIAMQKTMFLIAKKHHTYIQLSIFVYI